MKTISFDDVMIDRCCLYLLAEMSPEQAAQLEQEAITSDVLRACLTQQSELIAALGTACASPAPLPVAPLPVAPSVDQRRPESEYRFGGWAVGMTVALAASLLLLFGWDRPAQRNPEPVQDAVQLAHAWAAARSEGGSVESTAASARAVDEGERLPDPAEIADRPEGPPEWLIVAVRAAEADSVSTLETGEFDDG